MGIFPPLSLSLQAKVVFIHTTQNPFKIIYIQRITVFQRFT